MPIVEMVESLVNSTEIQCITPYQFKQALYIIMIVKTVTAILIMDMAIVGSCSLCYSAGRLSSKLPEQICSYITNVYLQHSAGCSQDSAGCIATNLSAR